MKVAFEFLVDFIVSVSAGNRLIAGLLAGTICMILTFLGAVPSALGSRVSKSMLDIGLGFSAGIMLVAAFTSLILPGIEVGGTFPVVIGFIIGAITIIGIERFLPHLHMIKGVEGGERFRERIKAVWMLVLAVIIHNFPEGLAVGASVSYNIREGILTAIAIGIQDIPEGLTVSLPLVGIGVRRRSALLIGLLSGASEPIMALIPIFLTSVANFLLPYTLGFAAGMMIFVVSHEIIPETHRHGFEDQATIGLLIGFIIMLILDSIFSA